MTTITPPTVERSPATNVIGEWWPPRAAWPTAGPIREALTKAVDAHPAHQEAAAELRRIRTEIDRAERGDDRARGIAIAEGKKPPERQAPALRARLVELERTVPERAIASDHLRAAALRVLAEHGPAWRAEITESRAVALDEYAAAIGSVRATRRALADIDALLWWHRQVSSGGRLRGAHARGEGHIFEAMLADLAKLSQPEPPATTSVEGDEPREGADP